MLIAIPQKQSKEERNSTPEGAKASIYKISKVLNLGQNE
jgi:hypothetical protein